jgi:3-hydroxy-9,10-secoandrosta-1,3,5(10)-triene-9,17-dione monooxygenase
VPVGLQKRRVAQVRYRVMTTAVRPTSLDTLLERAEALVPRLRERARATEELRRLPDETVDDFQQAGLFKVFQPARYGGYELDYGRTQVELCHILGQGCGSSAWVQSVIACHAWCLGMFGPDVQDAIWGNDPDALIASSFAPTTGKGIKKPGGYEVRGDWQFSSGSNLCSWVVLGTPIFDDESATVPSKMIWTVLPKSDWDVVDTWYAAGLKGSASNDVRVHGAFVPEAFTLDTSLCDGRPTPGSAANDGYIYQLPLWPIFPFNVSTPVLGIARGALQAYIDYTASRPERANMPQRQLRIADSACDIDAALALLRANASYLSTCIRERRTPELAFLTRSSRDTSYAVRLCVQAIDRLVVALGAHGMLDDNPIQRAARDAHAVANHAANSFDTSGVVYARFALGLPPEPRQR